MRFRILGPFEVHGDNGAVSLGGSKPRALLAMLLLHANEPVSADRLAVALWGEEAPSRALKAVQVHLSRLRKVLDDPDRIETTPAGYRMHVEPGELDSEEFTAHVEEGRRGLAAGRPEAAAAVLREALALWRGPALADMAFEPFAQAHIARLEEQRIAALEACIEAELAAGRHAEVVGELRELVALHAPRERLAAQLMLALYRCGRQTEALEAYADARRRLVEEVGVEPGPELQRLQDAILRQDASLEPRTPAADLPPELDPEGGPPLVGREREFAWLSAQWERAVAGVGAIVAVTGTAGVGKSRLVAELAGHVHAEGATAVYVAGSVVAVRAAAERAGRSDAPTLLVVDHADRREAELPAALGALAEVVHGRPVLAIAIGEDADAIGRPNGGEALALEPLDIAAVRELAARYWPAHTDDESIDWLRAASGGIPARAHELAAHAARREAARRVSAVASRAESGHAQLRSIEAELAGRIEDLQAAGGRAAGVGDRGPPLICPFKGLACFDIPDAPYFFGRERLVAELVARLAGAPLLGIVGPSGSGKSSVLRAGLLPALASGVLPGSETWRQVLLRPGEHPMRELRHALEAADERRAVIAVDQFEEIFTACRDERERAAFVDELARVAVRHDRVVLAIRGDHYGRCATYPALAGPLAANHMLVGPMRRDELCRAVECPAEQVGLSVDPALTDALIEDVAGEPGALPLLSTALLELWPRRDGRRLGLGAYDQTGGVRGAVARIAERAYADLDPAQQAVARDVLMHLVAEGTEGKVERRRVALVELEIDAREDVARVVEALADSRLLTISEGAVELAHEALLREWPRLAGWIEEDRESFRLQHGLSIAAKEWDRRGRDDSDLYRGSRLSALDEWHAQHNVALTTLERGFLDASSTRRAADRAARRRSLNLVFAGLVGALTAISVVAVVALHQAHEANREREISASRELASNATRTVESDPGLSLAIALQALGRWDTPDAERAVLQATNAAHGTGVYQLHDDWLWAVRPSRDGHEVVTSGKDGTVRVWDVDRRRTVATIDAHKGEVQDATLSRDGRRLAIAGTDDGKVTVSDPDGGDLRVVADFGPSVKSKARPLGVQFSPDRRHLAIPVSDGTVRIVPVDRPGRSKRLTGHFANVYSTSYSPDGERLVTASQDETARVWNLADDTSRVLAHPDAVESATFSPDGTHVATAGGDGVLRVWDANAVGKPRSIRFGRPSLLCVRYSPDGKRIVTAGIDGVVRVVDVRTMSVVAVFTGHSGQATQADFVDGGDAVASVGEDGTLRTWAVSPVTVIPADLVTVDVSADGRSVTGADQSGAVAVWDLTTGARRVLWRHTNVSFAKFSGDGTKIASSSWDATVRVGDPRVGAPRRVAAGGLAKYSVALVRQGSRVAFGGSDSDPRVVVVSLADGHRVVLAGHTEIVWDIDFSPDATHVVTASEDGTARIWDAESGRLERTLEGHGEGVTTARYSPEGEWIVTAGKDGTARVWPVAGGTPRILRGHAGPVSSAAFNARGDRVVTAGADGTVRVWSSRGGDALITVDNHAGEASGAAFTPDGRRVVSVGDDGVIRAVTCEACGPFSTVLGLARGRVRGNLSAEDQRRDLP